MEWQRYEYRVSTDPELLQMGVVHQFLSRSYWAKDISDELVHRAVAGSLCFGLYHGEHQVGLARVVTDRATFAYLSDVCLLDNYQGQGLGEWLIGCVMSHPDLQGLQRFMLADAEDHSFYRRYGFEHPAHPEHLLEIFNTSVYRETSHPLQ